MVLGGSEVWKSLHRCMHGRYGAVEIPQVLRGAGGMVRPDGFPGGEQRCRFETLTGLSPERVGLENQAELPQLLRIRRVFAHPLEVIVHQGTDLGVEIPRKREFRKR